MSALDINVTDIYLRCSKFPTTPETRLEVFRKHWLATVRTMGKEYLTLDESEPVIYYMEQMVSLMIEEKSSDMPQMSGPIFKYSLEQDVFNKIYEWSSKFMGEALERLKHQQLRLFSVIVSQAHPSMLHYKEILQPLLRLINSYSLRSSLKLERSLVHLLQLICSRVSNEPTLQFLCTEIGTTILNDPLPLLNPLVPFLHRDGILGQDAKSAVLLLLASSLTNEEVAISVALQSDFCPVLATGLSALYSALPRKLPPYCHSILLGQINKDTVEKYPPLQHFLEYLDFCCQVNNIAHPLVREAVLHYVYNGFLLPVIGSSFNQNSLDEVITATIYFDLFLRTITNNGLLKAFLCFIIAESNDGYRIMDSLLNRLNSNTGLGVATLSLINNLISFNCEDIMFELIFRYLIPCRHLLLKEGSKICEQDALKDSLEIFFELFSNSCDTGNVIEAELLNSARKSIERCNEACIGEWQFDYNGINPSPDYLDKILEPSELQSNKPFHGFLDHYSQLLEMRDNCKKKGAYSPSTSRRSNSISTYFDLDGSCNFTPRSQISRSNSFDTLTSLKYENDSQLNMCLQRLRYPSVEDLLEQKSRYVISYNIMDQMTDDESMGPVDKPMKDKEKYLKSFDLVKTLSVESVESSVTDSGINMKDIANIANSEEISDFTVNLNKIVVRQQDLRNCTFSLEDVMNSILNDEDKNINLEDFKRHSPTASVISLQSALTIEDNILSKHNNSQSNCVKISSSENNKIVTVGLFLNTILERFEKFHLNPFQVNLQLCSILISLLSFPQPLLRNYLLNPREHLNEGVKCLYKILNTVRSKMDDSKIKINISKKDDHYFNKTCLDAKSRLEKRYQLLMNGDVDSDEHNKIYGKLQNTESDVSIFKLNKTEKRHFNLLDFLGRKSNSNDISMNNGWMSAKGRQSKEELEYYTHLNLAFATILFDELCKEIASFSQEHYVFHR